MASTPAAAALVSRLNPVAVVLPDCGFGRQNWVSVRRLEKKQLDKDVDPENNDLDGENDVLYV
jgi:hypothetical protein